MGSSAWGSATSLHCVIISLAGHLICIVSVGDGHSVRSGGVVVRIERTVERSKLHPRGDTPRISPATSALGMLRVPLRVPDSVRVFQGVQPRES